MTPVKRDSPSIPDESASDKNSSLPPAYDSVKNVCDILDVDLYTDVVGVEPEPDDERYEASSSRGSTVASCWLAPSKRVEEPRNHDLSVEVERFPSDTKASAGFDQIVEQQELEESNVEPFDAGWNEGLMNTPPKPGSTVKDLYIRDGNVVVRIFQTFSPDDAIPENQVIELMTGNIDTMLDVLRRN